MKRELILISVGFFVILASIASADISACVPGQADCTPCCATQTGYTANDLQQRDDLAFIINLLTSRKDNLDRAMTAASAVEADKNFIIGLLSGRITVFENIKSPIVTRIDTHTTCTNACAAGPAATNTLTVAVTQPIVQGTTSASPATGKVTSVLTGIDCTTAGTDCSENYATSVTSVVLTAALVTPATSGGMFSGWSETTCGPVAGVIPFTCRVPLTAAKKVTATFTCELNKYRMMDCSDSSNNPVDCLAVACDNPINTPIDRLIKCGRSQQCQSVNNVNTWVEVTSP